ncbi:MULTISPECIES: type II toxin-antitoxin system HicB family antitoxin [Flavobacteriaceae]|uniref:type II toxin-antitoxin system HicB family antitoxin n=1 Tax=Flavobacteriaceae TaxID=49546 RepID=UPI001491B8F4|nr:MULTISPECIES: type II toxin-antitoxin system HicB family antitoxin [Allomuricauda]MDC6367224.1 type II toxin-antitoxin system HicB family antitoxin [Muricauda sp. AC10]
MANYLNHNGYIGSVEYSSTDGVLYGSIIGIDDLVSYEGESVKELESSFKEALEDYLETCKEIGKNPDKYYKGAFNVRTTSDKHRQLDHMAKRKNMKLNQLVNKAFDYLVENEEKVLD